MTQSIGRRAVLLSAGTAAIAAAVAVAAQPTDFRGTVVFEGGAVIPKGRLKIYLEDPAVQDKMHQRTAATQMESDGSSNSMAFSLNAPAKLSASPSQRIVVRLERADGWLLARGSAQTGSSEPMKIALKAVVY